MSADEDRRAAVNAAMVKLVAAHEAGDPREIAAAAAGYIDINNTAWNAYYQRTAAGCPVVAITSTDFDGQVRVDYVPATQTELGMALLEGEEPPTDDLGTVPTEVWSEAIQTAVDGGFDEPESDASIWKMVHDAYWAGRRTAEAARKTVTS